MAYRVIKCNEKGQEVLAYAGELREQTERMVCVVAPFGLPTRDLGYVVLKQGDIFTEWFYADKWYNVFRIQDVDTHTIKGYYFNFVRPARFFPDYLTQDDLMLDLFLSPTGEQLWLDEAEYRACELSDTERASVAEACQEVVLRIGNGDFTF